MSEWVCDFNEPRRIILILSQVSSTKFLRKTVKLAAALLASQPNIPLLPLACQEQSPAFKFENLSFKSERNETWASEGFLQLLNFNEGTK